MKVSKVLHTLAAVCTLAAAALTPLRAQQPAQQPAQPPATQQPAPAADPQISKVFVSDQTGAYTERRDYLLGPNDVIELRVMNEPQINGDFEIDMDGTVVFPFVDEPVSARCRTVDDVRRDVTVALGKFIKNPRVFMRVKEQRSRREALVYGAVRQYSKYDMRRPVRLLELISNSGGVTEQHNGTIQIIHTAPPMCEVESEPAQSATAQTAEGLPYAVYRVADLREGKAQANPYIRHGDIIYVAEASPIYVVGNVAQPANLYLREGMTLHRVLAQVGGVRDANEEKVTIYRQKPGGEQEKLVVNYRAIKQGKEKDMALMPYDIIEVPKRGFGARDIKDIIIGLGKTATQAVGMNAPTRILY